MHNQGVEVVSETLGCGRVAAVVELVDECLEALSSVAFVDGVAERFPVLAADPVAVSLGQLCEQVPQAVNGAVLAVLGRPALLDRFDQTGRTVGDDE